VANMDALLKFQEGLAHLELALEIYKQIPSPSEKDLNIIRVLTDGIEKLKRVGGQS
jgi:hypothetical protein